ncbi:MAG: N-acetyltransferase family protein [Pseudomonadota bacterium]
MVRPAVEGDKEAICDIWNEVTETSLATFTTELKSQENIDLTRQFYVVAQAESGVVLGFGTYFAFRGGSGYARTKEHSIYLAPAARGQGTGRMIMRALEDHARSAGVHSLFAGISGANPEGVAFHEAMGFDHIARLPEVGRKWDRWLDLVLMQKFLT